MRRTMGPRSFVAFMAVLALIALLGFGLLSKGGDTIAIGQVAPQSATEIASLKGHRTASIAEYRGRWVLVNFWASWCVPCRTEAPTLERFYRGNRARGFTVLGIDLDDASADAQKFARRYGLSYPILRQGDGRELRKAFGMTGFPESFLVDPRGRLRLIRRGPMDDAYLRHYVAPLLSHA